MSFRMSSVIGPQFKDIVNERVTSNRARTRKAIAKVNELYTKGKLNSPGVVRNHAEAAEAQRCVGRWEAIGRRVNRPPRQGAAR